LIPSKCIEVAKRLSAQDTDAVLAAIKSYQDLEVPIAKAQVKAVEDYKKGKTAVLGFLIGMIVKEAGTKIDSQLVSSLLIARLKTV